MAKPDPFSLALQAEGVSGNLAGLARSIYQQESSSGKNSKTSNAGAVGGMQIIPGTFAQMADKGWDITNPEHNMRAGIRYLKHLDKLSGGVPELTAAGYYSGPGGMAKAKQGIAVHDPRNPNAPSQLKYGQQVAARAGQAGRAAPQATQVAQAPMIQASASGAAPAPVAEQPALIAPIPEEAPVHVAQGPDQWEQFMQNYLASREQTPADLASFGEAPPQMASLPQGVTGYVPRPSKQPNFQPLTDMWGWV